MFGLWQIGDEEEVVQGAWVLVCGEPDAGQGRVWWVEGLGEGAEEARLAVRMSGRARRRSWRA
jgi:hypothetical protein